MEAAQSLNLVSVSKLNNTNWNVWKFQVKVILMAKGLYEITSGLEKLPNDTELKSTWLLKDAKAQEALVTRMEEGPLSHLMQCTSANEMWLKLESIYDRKSDVSMHLLNEQFYNIQFSNENVNSFITKVTNLCAKMKQQGEEVPEKMIITKIIMALPQKFKHFRSAWESVATDSQNINNLTARLLIEEERLGSENEETVALMSRKSERKCYHCGKTGHMKFQCKKIMECHYCKKKGHLMKDCYHRKQKENEGNKAGPSSAHNNRTHRNFALIAISNEIKSQINTDWFLDSGASQHMCKDKRLFHSYEPLKVSKNIRIGDGSTMKAIGQGNVYICAYNGQYFHDVTLYDVLYVPDLEVNLFSQGSALDKGLSLVSNSEAAKLINKDNVVCAMAIRSDKLFKMMFQIKSDSSSTFVSTLGGCQYDSCQLSHNAENCLLAKNNQDLMWWHKTT